MSRTTYSAEFKAKLVLEVLEGTESLEAIASRNQINPNMLRTWKKEFVENAARVFSESKAEREARRKEDDLKKERDKMYKTIGQLTLERDFLQDCFRENGRAVPEFRKDRS